MDDLKATLKSYEAQLNQVELALSHGQADPELIQLQNDMKELISLTQESLLSYEKSQLISALNNNDQKKTSFKNGKEENCLDDEMAKFYADIGDNDKNEDKCVLEIQPLSTCKDSTKNVQNFSPNEIDNLNEEFLDTIQNCDDISGTKCQAPFTTDWSGTSYHNAMIMNVIETLDNDDIQVKVLFLNPTSELMRLCPYLLDGKCRFTEESCKYSHGHTASLYDLHLFKEPDFKNFVLDSSCLAKHPDGLWHLASVVECLDDHQYTVKFLHKMLTTTLSITDIVPIDDHCDSSSDSDDDDNVILLDGVSMTAARKTIDLDKVGSWEQHTRGIGSKIMMKFGYKLGQGLGKEGEGRVEPVPVVVLPQGKSLDHCMNIKEKKQQKQEEKGRHLTASKHRSPTVFHFLNKTLGDKRKQKNKEIPKLDPVDPFGIEKKGVTSQRKKLSAHLLQNDSKIKELNGRVKKLRESVKRNQDKNPKVAKHLQEKLTEALRQLQSVQSSSKAIENHQNRSDTHRKMTKF
uniref:Zinc finger CCCH-type with G patch domain-containing protein n=1 Tax=Phallusia mammillata TaxID=59560 RepID=A0A6F9DWX2_9ASCI|nr:zinc finger CCCH-type with G patch domain-containing protein-like [Phallusia mammillata]